jgi:hypothetical protein
VTESSGVTDRCLRLLASFITAIIYIYIWIK